MRISYGSKNIICIYVCLNLDATGVLIRKTTAYNQTGYE